VYNLVSTVCLVCGADASPLRLNHCTSTFRSATESKYSGFRSAHKFGAKWLQHILGSRFIYFSLCLLSAFLFLPSSLASRTGPKA
jgi:hypothetical protein